MKKQNIIVVLTLFILISCLKDEDRVRYGFTIAFWNYTNEVYDAKMIIGGMKNGIFIPTDSISVNKIKLGGDIHPYYFINENRWKPNLDKIRTIPSERCYFMLKLSSQREEMIKKYEQQELMSMLLPSSDTFIDDYGRLLISIRDNQITGRAAKE
ncbi:hypothetical protein [Polaribacter uvawellassae]|uniref:hypothetical protein n=1 Tax=Polaribacter uvawellassae TaxID=3133495 RepID=UPI00321AB324